MHHGSYKRPRPLSPALFLLVSLAFTSGQVALPQEAAERTLQMDVQTPTFADTSEALVSVSEASVPLFSIAAVEPCNSSLSQIAPALHAYGLLPAYAGRRRLISDVLRQTEFGNLTKNTSEAPPLVSGKYFVDGVWGYIMGVIWFVLGAFFLCLWGSCKLLKKMPRWIRNMVLGKEEPTVPSTLALAIFNALTFLALFCAIVGVGLAYGANPKTFTTYHQFDCRARALLDKTANETANAASAFNNASAVFATLPPQTLARVGGEAIPAALRNASTALGSITNELLSTAKHDLDIIYDLVLALYITIYILISLILLTLLGEVVAFAAASPRLMGALMIAHWLLTAWLWICVGLAFDASQVFKGECRILKHYLEDPANTNNALGARLPCGRLQFAQQLFLTGEQDASNVTAQIDSQVLPLARALAANSNVTAPVPPPLCDPFANVTTPPGCVPADVFIPQAVAFYRDLAAKNPGVVQLIGLNADQVALLGNATLGVLNVLPDLQDLLFCTSIFATLNGINQHQCHTIRWASNLLWSSLVVCAAGMMPLQLLGWYWIRYMEAVRKEEEILAKAPAGAYRAPASSVDGGT